MLVMVTSIFEATTLISVSPTKDEEVMKIQYKRKIILVGGYLQNRNTKRKSSEFLKVAKMFNGWSKSSRVFGSLISFFWQSKE